MNMPSVWTYSSGNALSVLLRQRTKWGLKCSISVMGLSIQMELMVLSGSAATNAKVHTIWDVSHQEREKASCSPFLHL